jgi:hypothetical protein
MSPAFHDLVARQQRRLAVMWGAFVAATFLYVAIGVAIARHADDPPAAGVSSLPLVVGVATCGLGVAGVGVAAGRRFLVQALQGKNFGGTRGFSAGTAGPDLSDVERFLISRIPVYQSVMIITWASYEAAALVGLVLSILMRDPVPAVVGSVVTLILLASNRPQVEPFLAECDRWRRFHHRDEDGE